MVKEVESRRTKTLLARVTPELFDEAQEVADREFDGVVAVLVRVAVKRLIEERAPELVATDTDMRAA